MKKNSVLLFSWVTICLLFWSTPPYAGKGMPAGVVHIKTDFSYATLIKRQDTAVKKNKMGLVTRASATVGAKRVLKQKMPGNMVVGVYHSRFAVRMLKASIPAGIEAPLRFYITENSNKTASLSYKTPTSVFAPYKIDDLKKRLHNSTQFLLQLRETQTTKADVSLDVWHSHYRIRQP